MLRTFNLRPNSLLVIQSLWSNGFLGVLICLKVFAVCVKRILSEFTDSCFMTEFSRYTAQEAEKKQRRVKPVSKQLFALFVLQFCPASMVLLTLNGSRITQISILLIQLGNLQ